MTRACIGHALSVRDSAAHRLGDVQVVFLVVYVGFAIGSGSGAGLAGCMPLRGMGGK